jgi:hypothetical protein
MVRVMGHPAAILGPPYILPPSVHVWRITNNLICYYLDMVRVMGNPAAILGLPETRPCHRQEKSYRGTATSSGCYFGHGTVITHHVQKIAYVTSMTLLYGP